MKFNHVFSVVYALESNTPDGSDIAEHEHVSAVLKRITALIDNNEIIEAVGFPEDTYELEEDHGSSKRESSGH